MFDALAFGLIASGLALIVFRRLLVRLFIFHEELLFGLRVVRANERRIAMVPVAFGIFLVLLGVAEWAG